MHSSEKISVEIMNPHRLTIHDLIAYMDSVLLKEEIKTLVCKADPGSYEREQQQKKHRTALLITKLLKISASHQRPNTFLNLLNNLPDA